MKKNKVRKDFDRYLRSIGGLENGYKYIPYYWCHLNIFGRYFTFKNHKYYLFELFQLLGFKNNRNPFRDKIKSCGGWFGDGWLPITQKMIEDCIELGWNKQVCQVKEKFGGGRFYINGASDKIHNRIEQWEEETYKTCENCGSTENVTTTGSWLKTYCNNCNNK